MGRMILTVVFAIIFLGWILYHLIIKRDLMKQKNNLYAGLFFIAVWAVIFWLMYYKQ